MTVSGNSFSLPDISPTRLDQGGRAVKLRMMSRFVESKLKIHLHRLQNTAKKSGLILYLNKVWHAIKLIFTAGCVEVFDAAIPKIS